MQERPVGLARGSTRAQGGREPRAASRTTRIPRRRVSLPPGRAHRDVAFVESGRLAVLIEAPGEKPRQVRSFTAHTIVGEIGFFAQSPRTATLLVEENAIVWSLDRATFETLRQRDADSAAALYAYVIRILAERLAFASRQAAAAIR